MKKGRTRRFFPLGLIFTFWALSAVWIRHETVKVSYEVGQKRAELKKLQTQSAKLRTRMESLLAHDRLERLAKGRFNLGPPKKDQIIYIPE